MVRLEKQCPTLFPKPQKCNGLHSELTGNHA